MKEVYDGKRFKDRIAVSTIIEPTRKAVGFFSAPIDKTSLTDVYRLTEEHDRHGKPIHARRRAHGWVFSGAT